MNNLLSLIKDKSYLIVCDSETAIKYLIKKTNEVFKNKLVDISYMTLNELISKLNFIKSDEIVLKVMDNFDLSYDSANMYIDNILQTRYLKHRECNNEKLLFPTKIEMYLEDHNLFKKDDLIKYYLSNKEVIIYSSALDEYQKYLLKDINYTFVSYLENKENSLKVDVLSFKNNDEEIAYVCESIIENVNNNVNKKDIYLVCEDNDYLYSLKRISGLFNLNFNIKSKVSLLSINFVNKLLDKYFNNQLEELNLESLNKDEYDLYKQVINEINKYVMYTDYKSYKEYLLKKICSVKKISVKNKNAINVIGIDEAFYLAKSNSDALIYVVGLYQGNIPAIKKDEDYYSDIIKKQYGIFDSAKVNTLRQYYIKELLCNSSNIKLSYSKKSNFSEYIISSIVNVIDVNEVKINFEISKYSNKYNIENYYKKYDTFSKYGTKDNNLELLHNTYNDNTYNSYSNKFKGVNPKKVLKKKDNKLNLSYSAMNTYSQCAFSYYLKYILGLDSFKGNFMTFIGSVYHYVIEKHFKKEDYDFDVIYNEAIELESQNYQMTISETFLMNKLKEELKVVLEYLDYQLDYINYKDAMFEQKAEIRSKVNVNGEIVDTKFTGYIDKLLYKKITLPSGEEATLVAIVDYKTSTKIKFEVDLVAYGLSLQLPIYAYLANYIDGVSNVIVGGMFIQPILNSKVLDASDSEEKYNKKLQDLKRLDGCINSDLSEANKFASSEIISKSTKDYSTGSINELVDEVSKIIDRTFVNISKAKFDINPKRVNNKVYGCEYCEFNDICYHKEADYVDISIVKEEKEDA